MQCTSYIPVYYHARNLNVVAGGLSWNPFDSNANYREERGYSIATPPYNMDQYLGYDKEVLKQIIQNHEVTFKHQVQELHRLYRRQRELMDEMRMREIFAQHLLSQSSETIHSLSHARSEFSRTPSHSTSWLLGDLSSSKLPELTAGDIHRPRKFIAENFQESTTSQPNSFIRRKSYNDVKFLSSSSNENENRIVDLELPAEMYHDDQEKQFKEGNLSEASEKVPKLQPASDSDIDSVKTGDLSSSNLNSKKATCFIDLNEPIELESLPSSSGPFETYTSHMATARNDASVSVEASPESVVPKHSELLNCDGSSDGMSSSVAIDLNSMPLSCFSETEITLENLQSLNKETAVDPDCSSACNHSMKKGGCADDNYPVIHNKINDKILKTETYIDLNTGIVDERSQLLSSSISEIKSAEDTVLEGPVSPENEECSPPRGKSEDIQVGTPLLSEQGEREPSEELETIVAQTLVMISSSGVEEYTKAAVAEPLLNFRNTLCWFAEIVSSTGDDLENEIMKLENDAAGNHQDLVSLHGVYDFGALTLKSKENALNFSHVKKEKETGALSRRCGKGRTRAAKQRKDFQIEVVPSLTSLSEDVHTVEGFIETVPLRRKPGRKACAKPRKYSKISTSDAVKKSMSSILKQPATRSKQGVLQSWGKIRKRQGGRRRRVSEFLLFS